MIRYAIEFGVALGWRGIDMAHSEQATGSVAILVLGMHRSGTSVVTRGLVALGVELGTRLMPPQEDNPKGHWENLSVFELNERFLQRNGTSWNSMVPIHWQALPEVARQEYRHLAERVLRKEFGESPLVGFKDPRICRLLPMWMDACGATQRADRYVIVVRNLISVARSLESRDGFLEEKSYVLWLLHTVPSILLTEGKVRSIVDYDRFVAEPYDTMMRVASELELPVDESTRTAVAEFARDFVTDDLRHTAFDLEAVMSNDAIPKPARDLYRELVEVAAGKGSLRATEFADAVIAASRYLEVTGPLLRLADELDRRNQRDGHTIGRLTAEAAQHAAVLQDRDAHAARSSALESELALAGRESQLLREELQLLREERLHALREREHALAERQRWQDEVARLLSRQSEIEQQHDRCAAELQASRSESARLSAVVEEWNRRAAATAQERERLVQHATALEAQVQALRGSTSWRVTAPMRAVAKVFHQGDE